MTVVNRRTFIAERGQQDAALTILQDLAAAGPNPYRIYRPAYATFDAVVVEVEFESVAAMDTYWNSFFTDPQYADRLAQWEPLVKSGGTNEIWTLTAHGPATARLAQATAEANGHAAAA